MRSTLTRATMVAVTATAAMLALAGCTLLNAGPAETTTPSDTTAPAATQDATPTPDASAAPEAPTYSSVYEVGSCLALTGDTKYLVPPVPCSQEHEEEVFLFFDFPEGGLPDRDGMSILLKQTCDAAFTAYVGLDEETSKYGYYGATPSEGSYEAGHREGMCVAFADIHDITNLPVIVGSIKGTNE